jgi:hypothetical protein
MGSRSLAVSQFSKYDIDDVPACYRAVLRRIEQVLGDPVLITSFDSEWLCFHVTNWPDRTVAIALQAKSPFVFPGNDRYRYQVVCPWNSDNTQGLLLHYMPQATTRSEYRWGCWFF